MWVSWWDHSMKLSRTVQYKRYKNSCSEHDDKVQKQTLRTENASVPDRHWHVQGRFLLVMTMLLALLGSLPALACARQVLLGDASVLRDLRNTRDLELFTCLRSCTAHSMSPHHTVKASNKTTLSQFWNVKFAVWSFWSSFQGL